MTVIDPHSSQIQQKLAQLRRHDRSLVVFGADSHKYCLKPTASEQTVLAFEEHYGISLPPEYRRFIRTVGNGGAGPNYGIFSLDEAAVELEYESASSPWVSHLAKPFSPPQTFEEAEELDFLAPGVLPVCHHGCGSMVVLVVSGSERGNIWYWSNTWIPCPQPGSYPSAAPNAGSNIESGKEMTEWQRWATKLLAKDNTYRIDFLDWYEEWLDEKLTAYREQTYPFGLLYR